MVTFWERAAQSVDRTMYVLFVLCSVLCILIIICNTFFQSDCETPKMTIFQQGLCVCGVGGGFEGRSWVLIVPVSGRRLPF